MKIDNIIRDIKESEDWDRIIPIEEGWSGDSKYHIITNDGQHKLLRISEADSYERKAYEYKMMQHMIPLSINVSKPLAFGRCRSEGYVYVYTLLTWVHGEPAEGILPGLSKEKQYALGYESGRILKEIHSIRTGGEMEDWALRFNRKIDRNIQNYQACGIAFEGAENVIDFIDENRCLLDGRPQCFQQGDYHIGNMIINDDGTLGVIDFNRLDYGDPWDEYNRISWCVEVSPEFASARLHAYFEGNPPEDFFRLMALYIGSNMLSSLPWAKKFGDADVQTMLKQNGQIMTWYERYTTCFPTWYIEL